MENYNFDDSSEHHINSSLFQILISQLSTRAIFIVNQLGDVLFWNNGSEKIFGYTTHEIKSKNLSLCMDPRNHYFTELQFYLKETVKHQTFKANCPWITKQRVLFWSETEFSALYSSNDEHCGFAIHVNLINNADIVRQQLINIGKFSSHNVRPSIGNVRQIIELLKTTLDSVERNELINILYNSTEQLDQVQKEFQNQIRNLYDGAI